MPKLSWDGILDTDEHARIDAYLQSVEAPRAKSRKIRARYRGNYPVLKHLHNANRCAWVHEGRVMTLVPGLDPFGRLLQLEAEAAAR